MKFKHVFMLMAAAMFSFACNDDDKQTDPTPDPTPEADFTLSVYDITKTDCRFKVSPKDKDMTYVALMSPSEQLAEFPSDTELIQDDIYYFIDAANSENKDLGEWLEENLNKGDMDTAQKELRPATEYTLYVYGMSLDGVPTTDVYRSEFTTQAVEQVDATFSINIDELTKTSCTITAEATPASTDFFINIIDEESYQFHGGNTDAFAAQVDWLADYYVQRGRTREEIYKNLGSRGTSSFTRDDLLPGQKYYAFAIGIDKEFRPNTAPEVVEITAVPVEASDNEITISIESVSFDGLTAIIETTNEDGYLWGIQPASLCDQMPSDEAIMWELASVYKSNGVLNDYFTSGYNWIGDIDYLQPDTDYYVIAFGWDDAPTTSLFKAKVHTLSADADPESLTVSMSIDELTYNSATVTTTGSSAVYYFADIIEAATYEETLQSAGSLDAAVKQLAEEAIEWGAEYFGCSTTEYLAETGIIGRQKYTYYDLTPETSYIVYAISVDMETGQTAAAKGFVSEVFTTPEHIISDASVTFIQGHHYDGDALAAADPDKYGNLAGKALLTYSIDPNASAAHWYSNFYYDDWTYYGDDWIEMMLITYGYDMGNPDKVQYDSTSGAYVLPYDTQYSFVAMAKDANGILGYGVVVPIMLSKADASPVEEFLASQSAVMRAPFKPAYFERRPHRIAVESQTHVAETAAGERVLPYAIDPANRQRQESQNLRMIR